MQVITPEIEQVLIELAESTIQQRDAINALNVARERHEQATRVLDVLTRKLDTKDRFGKAIFHAMNREMQIADHDDECFDNFTGTPKPQCCSHTRIQPVLWPMSLPAARYRCIRCNKTWRGELPEELRANVEATEAASGV
jgi:hypothetical protein